MDFFTKILGWFLIRKLGNLLQEKDPLAKLDKNTIDEIKKELRDEKRFDKVDAETKKILGLPPKFSSSEEITDEYLNTYQNIQTKYYDEIKRKYHLTEKQWSKIFGDDFLERWDKQTPGERAECDEKVAKTKNTFKKV